MKKAKLFALSAVVFSICFAAGCASTHKTGEPDIFFLNKGEAAKAILDDGMDPYFEKLLPLEMSAKTGAQITGETLDDMRAEFKRRYQENVSEFTDKEKETLRWYIARIYKAVEKDYPAFAEMPWRFVKITDGVECGLPHTRGKCIFLHEDIIHYLTILKDVGTDVKNALAGGIEILVHEQFHVYQRTHKNELDDFYTGVMGYEKVKKIMPSKWMSDRQVVNPDATECNWVFRVNENNETKWYMPAVIFWKSEGLQVMPDNFRFVGVEVEGKGGVYTIITDGNGKPLMEDLSNIKEYHDKFTPVRDIYHPYENAAACFAYIVAFDALIEGEKDSQEAGERMEFRFGPSRKWLKEHLAAK